MRLVSKPIRDLIPIVSLDTALGETAHGEIARGEIAHGEIKLCDGFKFEVCFLNAPINGQLSVIFINSRLRWSPESNFEVEYTDHKIIGLSIRTQRLKNAAELFDTFLNWFKKLRACLDRKIVIAAVITPMGVFVLLTLPTMTHPIPLRC